MVVILHLGQFFTDKPKVTWFTINYWACQIKDVQDDFRNLDKFLTSIWLANMQLQTPGKFILIENYTRMKWNINATQFQNPYFQKCSWLKELLQNCLGYSRLKLLLHFGRVTFIFLVRVFDKVSCYLKEHSFRVKWSNV